MRFVSQELILQLWLCFEFFRHGLQIRFYRCSIVKHEARQEPKGGMVDSPSSRIRRLLAAGNGVISYARVPPNDGWESAFRRTSFDGLLSPWFRSGIVSESTQAGRSFLSRRRLTPFKPCRQAGIAATSVIVFQITSGDWRSALRALPEATIRSALLESGLRRAQPRFTESIS